MEQILGFFHYLIKLPNSDDMIKLKLKESAKSVSQNFYHKAQKPCKICFLNVKNLTAPAVLPNLEDNCF